MNCLVRSTSTNSKLKTCKNQEQSIFCRHDCLLGKLKALLFHTIIQCLIVHFLMWLYFLTQIYLHTMLFSCSWQSNHKQFKSLLFTLERRYKIEIKTKLFLLFFAKRSQSYSFVLVYGHVRLEWHIHLKNAWSNFILITVYLTSSDSRYEKNLRKLDSIL